MFAKEFCYPPHVSYPRSDSDFYADPWAGKEGDSTEDSKGLFHYQIPVYLSDDPPPGSNRLSYNLLTSPQDICIYTWGGNETGFGYHSNNAVASRSQIINATGKLPP